MGYDGIVIGGGAAGMFAAITAAKRGQKVLLLEKNDRLGRKLLITGKGRCNVTNNCASQEVLQNVPRNGRFLYSAMTAFPPEKTMAFFEERGCRLKTERGNRVFPVTDKSQSILDCLLSELHRQKITVKTARVRDILTRDGHVTGVRTQNEEIAANWVILATGGASYPATGSTGDGYRMAAALGHEIVPPCGSLVPLVSDDGDCRRMQGLALKNVELTALNGKNKVQFRDFGELLFTHFGVSGPLVLSASAHLRHWDREKYRLCIDLKPALDRDKLEARILRDLGENPNRDFEKIVAGLVPHSMVPVLLDRLEVPAGLKANSVTRQQRRALEELLKCFSVSVTGPRPVAEAIVTSGGVQVSQVQPSTMESKLAPGLYFAGEILDVDAYTGGFNLQIAWSTGHLAGTSAAGAEGE